MTDVVVDVRGGEGDDARLAVPGVLAVRVVQDDEPAGGEVVVTVQDFGGEREGVRRESQWRRDLAQADSWVDLGRAQGGHGNAKTLGASSGSTAMDAA